MEIRGAASAPAMSTALPGVTSSYVRTRNRFSNDQKASRYSQANRGNRRDEREQACILKALQGVAPGARVLDIPCGAGRIDLTLVKRGLLVAAADISPSMLEQARRYWQLCCATNPELENRARFEMRDIMSTGYPDGEFDAVVCNRLFHHFIEPEIRIAALTELGRICSGPIVVSFFNSFAIETLRLALLRTFFGKYTRDRIPIPLRRFAREADSAGLLLTRAIATRWGISPQWYAVFHRKPASAVAVDKG